MARFIADIGSNHNGSLERLLDIIRAAKDSGFDAVKTQQIKPDKLWADQGRWSTGQYILPGDYPEIRDLAHSLNLELGMTPLYLEALDLTDYVDFIKVGSYEASWSDLLWAIRCKDHRLPVILSTGLSTIPEISRSLEVLGNSCIEIMHCVSKYPTPYGEARLNRIDDLGALGVDVGYSDHTHDTLAVSGAVQLHNASSVELHLDLDDKQGAETKHGHVWTASEAKDLIASFPKTHWDKERAWRRDPRDGLRPMRWMR